MSAGRRRSWIAGFALSVAPFAWAQEPAYRVKDVPIAPLVGETVALDPAGFAFDTPLSERPR